MSRPLFSRLPGVVTLAVTLTLILHGPAPAGDGCPGEGSCFEDNGSPGCDDELCCTIVCEQDFFCCKGEWDNACAQLAGELCDSCPAPGSCLVYHESPGCNDAECCEMVCDIEPICCQLIWDGNCLTIAGETCGLCLGDQNDDGDVDVQDLVIIITDWACEGGADVCPGDVTGNGVVDVNDLIFVIVSWGPCV